MKKLYLIGGTMGVGKTSVSKRLSSRLPSCVFLDGDWCWCSYPFIVNDETKTMVIDNIVFMLNQFIHCESYRSIVFCWVMHKQSIINDIINKLDKSDVEIKSISLTASAETIKSRLGADIVNGIRSADVVDRSLERLKEFQGLNTTKLCTDGKSVDAVADEILAL